MKRKIYNELLEWKKQLEYKPLMILGVRQCGKTYVINEFCRNEYKHFTEINLFERQDIVQLYKSNDNSDEKFVKLKAYLNVDLEADDTIIFIDEIQESEELISELKYFSEKHPKMRVICAGSLLGVKLKRLTKSFPVGKVITKTMYPMDFEEFLMALQRNDLIDLIKDCFNDNKSIGDVMHNYCMNLYKSFLYVGGMPESVHSFVTSDSDYVKYDNTILKTIKNDYCNDMKKHVDGVNDTLKLTKLYNSLPSQLANESRKFQYSKIEKSARKNSYEYSIEWIESANLAIKTKLVSLPKVPLEGFVDNEYFKLYLSDVGLLNNMLNINIINILRDDISLYKGAIAENYVANQLKCNKYNLYYWKNNSQAEIDFLITSKDGYVIPIEVKAATHNHSASLDLFMKKYNSEYGIRISARDFGYDEKKRIKAVPLYAAFCI